MATTGDAERLAVVKLPPPDVAAHVTLHIDLTVYWEFSALTKIASKYVMAMTGLAVPQYFNLLPWCLRPGACLPPPPSRPPTPSATSTRRRRGWGGGGGVGDYRPLPPIPGVLRPPSSRPIAPPPLPICVSV